MKNIIHYAHCIKFTPGCLDREPFSAYELRAADVYERAVYSDDGKAEWQILHNSRILSWEDNLLDAQTIAAYELMRISREESYHAALKLAEDQGSKNEI